MNAPQFPTPWQKKTIWAALTGLAVVTIGAISIGIIWLVSHVLAFLQPILIPFAIAGVLAYLLDPVVSKMVSWGCSRHYAVFAVFAVVTIAFAGVVIWIVPAISEQSINLARKVPTYTRQAHVVVMQIAKEFRQTLIVPLEKLPSPLLHPEKLGGLSPVNSSTPPVEPHGHDSLDSADTLGAGSEEGAQPGHTARSGALPDEMIGPPAPPGARENADASAAQAPEHAQPVTTPHDSATTGAAVLPPAPLARTEGDKLKDDENFDLKDLFSGDWLQGTLLDLGKHLWVIIRESMGGFLGVVGFLISLIIVPIYLYYFLTEAPYIAAGWSDYLPLRASAFKDECVAVISEINGYLIAFFRGQLVVSLINGTVTGVGLVIAGLDFGLLIGIALCFLGLVPYLGISMCWIVSAIIASVQGGSWCVPPHPWWVFPLVISGVFIIVHNVDGLFVTPKIVGESVGLHPLTVIVSVFVWSLLMGGLLGAILAVPMTATMKVLLKRYVWDRQFRTPEVSSAVTVVPSAEVRALTGTPAEIEPVTHPVMDESVHAAAQSLAKNQAVGGRPLPAQ